MHTFLAKSLREVADTVGCRPCMRNAAFQLALCHGFGFGVAHSELECALWLGRSGRPRNDLTATLDRIKKAEPKAHFVSNLASRGYRNDLPLRYSRGGILETAIDEYRSMVLARSDAFGPSHFSTLRLKDILIKMLRWNKENKPALDLALDTLQTPGLKASDVRDIKYTLSLIYAELGNTTKAEEFGKEILQVPSEDDAQPEAARLDYQANLVDIYVSKGQFGDAIDLGTRTVQDCDKELGPEHWSSRAAKRSLAKAYVRTGDLPRALVITEELVRTQEHVPELQNPSPKLVEDVSRLGLLYFGTGDMGGALTCYDRIQGWIARDIGNATFATNEVNNHAVALLNRGAVEEAMVILEALLQKCNESLGSNSKEAAMVMGNLAVVFHKQAEWNKAELLERQVVETRRRILGTSHPNTIVALGNCRTALLAQNKVAEAVDLAKEEVQCVKGAADVTVESIIHALLTISGALESAGAFAEAIPFLEETIGLRDAETPNPQQGVLSAILLEAICYYQLDRMGDARDAIFRLLTSFTTPFKEDLDTFIPGLLRLAEMCLDRGCTVEAEQVLVGAALLSQKSPLVSQEAKAKVDVAFSRYLKDKGGDQVELSFNPFLITKKPMEDTGSGPKTS